MTNNDDDFDDEDWERDPDYHGAECDCEECREEDGWEECSYVHEHGGCMAAGSEWCDWECPMRRLLDKQKRADELKEHK